MLSKRKLSVCVIVQNDFMAVRYLGKLKLYFSWSSRNEIILTTLVHFLL